MKKLFILLAICIFANLHIRTFAQTFLLTEDFTSSSGTTPPAGWTVNVVSGDAAKDIWRFDNPGNRTIGHFITGSPFAILDNSYNASVGAANNPKTVEMISPSFTITAAQKSSALTWYEYFVGGFGGKGVVYFSIDNGASWIAVDSSTSDSYSNPVKKAVDLNPYLSVTSTCKVKFVWTSPDNGAFWWIVDDILLYTLATHDAEALRINALPSGCVISLTTPVTITSRNLSKNAINQINLNYQLNGGPVVSETYLVALAAFDTFTYTFLNSPTLLNGVPNDLVLWPSDPGSLGQIDNVPANDTIFYNTTVNQQAVALIPFYDGFEDSALNAAWCAKPGPSGYGRIRLIDATTSAPCSDNQMLGMDAVNDGSSIDVLDLLVDLSSCVQKALVFTYGNKNDALDPEDGLYLSVNNGLSFEKIMSFDFASSNGGCNIVSLVNLDSIANTLINSITGNPDTLTATTVLRWQHAGNDSLESGNDGFYLDEVKIDLLNVQQVDVALNSVSSPTIPVSVVSPDSVQVIATFTNNSPDPLISTLINYQYANGDTVTEFWGGCLGLGSSDTFTFVQWLKPPVAAEKLCVWLSSPNGKNDLNNSNDKICFCAVDGKFAMINDTAIFDTTICFGNSVNLNTVGGTTYAWSPSAFLTCNNCANPVATPDTTISYTVIASDQDGCSDTAMANITVIPLGAVASVNIAAFANPSCTGDTVTFVATPTNGGLSPNYQWKRNSMNIGTNSGTYLDTFTVNDTVVCVMTSSAGCAVGSPDTSNTIIMNVSSSIPASVSISADTNSICSGVNVTFTATHSGGGVSPVYQWKLNGANVGTNSSVYSNSSLSNGDTVNCMMTSSLSCATGSPAISNTVTMIVNPILPASVSISESKNPACSGDTVNFTATPTNGGSTPAYQWKLNGTNVGTNNATYSNSALTNGNSVACVMTSSLVCVSGSPDTSNAIAMTVVSLLQPTISQIGNTLSCSDTAASSYQWYDSIGAISGATSKTYTITKSGNYKVEITDDNSCKAMSNFFDATFVNGIKDLIGNLASVGIYPTPFSNQTKISYTLNQKANVSIEIFNLIGKKINTLVKSVQNNGHYEFVLTENDLGNNAGIYLIKIGVNEKTTTLKLVLLK